MCREAAAAGPGGQRDQNVAEVVGAEQPAANNQHPSAGRRGTLCPDQTVLSPCRGAAAEAPGACAEKQQLKELAASVDIAWHKRLAQSSPLQAGLQQDQVDKALEAWIESQVNHIDDKRCAPGAPKTKLPRIRPLACGGAVSW